MPLITDTVLDTQGRPAARAHVLIDVLVSAQKSGSGGSPGTPAKRRLIWRGFTDSTGTWVADLPPQSRWGDETFYTVSVRCSRVRTIDEFTVDSSADRVQIVRDRLRPGRPARNRSVPAHDRPERKSQPLREDRPQ